MAKNRRKERKVSAKKMQRALPGLTADFTAPPGRGETPRQFIMRHQDELSLGLHRRDRRLNLTPVCGGETAKQFVKRHIAMGNAGPHLRHRQLKRVLERRGFVVKTVERKDYHPIWNLSLRPGTVTDAWDYRVVRRHVSKALLELGHICRPKDVGAVVAGQVLQVSFGWSVGKPGILTFWSSGKGLDQGIRTCWIPITTQNN
jgi:hypothetical protein